MVVLAGCFECLTLLLILYFAQELYVSTDYAYSNKSYDQTEGNDQNAKDHWLLHILAKLYSLEKYANINRF